MTEPTVLIVLASADRRGAEVEGLQLAAELSARGVVATAVACAPAAAGSAAPLEVQVLGARPLSLGSLRALRRLARGVDVVVALGSSTLPACALALLGSRTPFVYRSIGDPARWVRGGWHRRRTGVLFRRAAHVIALWPGAAASIHELYGVSTDAITCIPNARPAAKTTPPSRASARSAFGLPAEANVVAWVGALSHEKRPVAAVEAVASMPGAWLLLAGGGPLQADVAAVAQRLMPGRHRLLGVVADLVPVWAACDVALLTSATEGMPGVLIEAALHGVPAVATDVGAVDSVVSDGRTGRVVPAEAGSQVIAGALADALAQRVAWGSAARLHVTTHFTWQSVAPQWVELLRRVGSRAR